VQFEPCNDLTAVADNMPNKFHPVQGMVAKQAKNNPNILPFTQMMQHKDATMF